MTEAQLQSTKLSTKWQRRILIFFALFFGLGLWGLIDAIIVYPKRGRAFADFVLAEYMTLLETTSGYGLSDASVEDPAARFTELTDLREAGTLDTVGEAERIWLEALSRLGSLNSITSLNEAGGRTYTMPEAPADEKRTVFDNPREVHDALAARFANEDPPKPLSGFDLPSQWVIAAVGMIGAFFVALNYVRARSRSYRYDPSNHTLHLPGNNAVTPDDIDYLDKRKWDKWFVFLKLKDRDEEVKLDLLKYEPLEDWILEIEKQLPGYEPEPEADAESDADAPADADPVNVGDDARSE